MNEIDVSGRWTLHLRPVFDGLVGRAMLGCALRQAGLELTGTVWDVVLASPTRPVQGDSERFELNGEITEVPSPQWPMISFAFDRVHAGESRRVHLVGVHDGQMIRGTLMTSRGLCGRFIMLPGEQPANLDAYGREPDRLFASWPLTDQESV